MTLGLHLAISLTPHSPWTILPRPGDDYLDHAACKRHAPVVYRTRVIADGSLTLQK